MKTGARILLAGGSIFLLVTGSAVTAAAQSGSVGGAIPKQNKTVSGGGRENSAPRKSEQKPPRKRTAAASATLAGIWRVSQKCNTGRFEIELDITHSSPTEFSGTSRGITTGSASTIVGGQLENGNIEFSRSFGIGSDHWTGRMSGAGRFTGTLSGPVYTCSYTAVRK